MFHYKITIQYDGSGFLGWQSQNNNQILTVEDYIKDSLLCLFGKNIQIQGAGRTDSGVHALGQVANFSSVKYFPPITICKALNFHMKTNKVVIVDCQEVDELFNARFSAKSREYVYRIINSKFYCPTQRSSAWHISYELNLDEMISAAKYFLGTHDFNAFRKSECQAKSSIRTIDKVDIINFTSIFGNEIHIIVKAKSFLHSQVRVMVGTLVEIGLGKIKSEKLKDIIASKDRNQAGRTAPPNGLFLAKVEY